MIRAGNGELYFCVDGGGSRSRGRFVDIEGRVLAEATGGPHNPSINLERAVASVVGLWSQCCSVIGRPNNQFEGVVFAVGAAGTIAGDRGAGSWIGQKALRHCFAALDGVVPKDALSRETLRAIGGVERLRTSPFSSRTASGLMERVSCPLLSPLLQRG